jgi:hypothetical protein
VQHRPAWRKAKRTTSDSECRLCKALLDRITDRAHILETGTESYRFRRTLAKGKKGEEPAEVK